MELNTLLNRVQFHVQFRVQFPMQADGGRPHAINEIVLGKRTITPAMSIRFGVFFGQSDTFWHGIQVECDFRALAKKRKSLIHGIQPARVLVGA